MNNRQEVSNDSPVQYMEIVKRLQVEIEHKSAENRSLVENMSRMERV